MQLKPIFTKSIHSYMNSQPSPGNTVIAAITIVTSSRRVLNSKSHFTTQADKKNKTKVTESVVGSYLQRFSLGDGGLSLGVFCGIVCAAWWSL